MSEGSFDLRLRLKARQWDLIGQEMRSFEPTRDILLTLRARQDPTQEPRPEIDRILMEAGLNQLGEKWVEVEMATAQAILARSLGRSLLGGPMLMEPIELTATVDHLLQTMKYHPRYFTNVLAFDDEGLSAWNPISGEAFDAAVAGVDNDFVGIIAVRESGRPDRP